MHGTDADWLTRYLSKHDVIPYLQDIFDKDRLIMKLFI